MLKGEPTNERVCFSSAIHLSFAFTESPLTQLDKEVTDGVTKSSLFQLVYKNNSLNFKGKKGGKLLSKLWLKSIQKKLCPPSALAEVITAFTWAPTSAILQTDPKSSSAAEIWLEST